MSSVEKKIKRQEWRKICKKRRRKLVRQKAARERDRLEAELQTEREADPQFQAFMMEKQQQDAIMAGREVLESALRNAQWLEQEHEAQLRFREVRQQLEAKEREELEKRDRIRKEFEERERRIEDVRAERRRQQEELVRLVRERHTKLQEFAATGIDDYLSELQEIHCTRANIADCKFFEKTGTCRHGLRCSGNHPTPGLSKIILIANFFNHPALDRAVHLEYGNDARLEFDEDDLRNSFTDFFRDIVDEFEQFGRMHQLLVCRNYVPHLRGNVYIEYENMRNAATAYLRMNGRFYAKKQLHVEFRSPIVWPAAVCGQFELKRCQKGSACNFLHIFKNPDHRYQYDHFQASRSMRKEASIVPATPLVQKTWDEITSLSTRLSRTASNWRWSESPEPENRVTNEARERTGEAGSPMKRTHELDNVRQRRSRSREKRSRRSRTRSRIRKRSGSGTHKRKNYSTDHGERRSDPKSDDKRSNEDRKKHRSRTPSHTSSKHSRPKKWRRKSRSRSRGRATSSATTSSAKKKKCEQQI